MSRWCHPTISSSVIPFSSGLQSFPASRSFQMSQTFTSGGQSIGVSASALALPVSIKDWFPLEWTGWISMQSKGLSRVFSNTTVQSINYLVLSFLHSSTLTSIHDYQRKPKLWPDGLLLASLPGQTEATNHILSIWKLNLNLTKYTMLCVVMDGCESWTIKKAEHQRIDALNCGVGEDSWGSLGLQGDPTSPF